MSSKGYKIFQFFNIVFMLFIVLVTAYPVYYVVVASFSDPNALTTHSGLLWKPLGEFTTTAYELVFANRQIYTGFLNTMYIMVCGLAINMILTTLGAFFSYNQRTGTQKCDCIPDYFHNVFFGRSGADLSEHEGSSSFE